MKHRFYKYTKNLLCAAIAFSWWFSATYPCLIFLGEVPYPKKED